MILECMLILKRPEKRERTLMENTPRTFTVKHTLNCASLKEVAAPMMPYLYFRQYSKPPLH